MPFTPAHSAVVLPFLRSDGRYISATGLVIGSLAPDFEYFFKLSVNDEHSHTWWGILYFNVPVVVLLALAFHLIVKQNLILNLPVALRQRFVHILEVDIMWILKNRPLVFITSAAVGSASHIFWDAFTHANGFFARTLPFYHGAYVPYEGARYPLWYALQQISTTVGLTILAVYIFLMPRSKSLPVSRPSLWYWLCVTLLTAATVALRFLIKSSDYNIGNFVVSCISGFCIALIICGLIRFNSGKLG